MGFAMALAQQPEAMKQFSNMSEAEKSQILNQIHAIDSKEEMQSFVARLVQ